MKSHELADHLEALVHRLRREPPSATPHDRRFEIVPGLVLAVPSAEALKKRRKRARGKGDAEGDAEGDARGDAAQNVPPPRPPSEPSTARPSPAPLELATPARVVRLDPSEYPESEKKSGHSSDLRISQPDRLPARSARPNVPTEGGTPVRSVPPGAQRDTDAFAMAADWPFPDDLVTSLEMAPGIPRRAARWILRQACGYYAQDAADRRAEPVWRKALHVWACKTWSDPKKRAEAMAASAPSQQVGGHHEGPVERLDPPAEWTAAVRRPVEPAPAEALELLARLRAGRSGDDAQAVADGERPSPAIVARRQGQNGGGAGHG